MKACMLNARATVIYYMRKWVQAIMKKINVMRLRIVFGVGEEPTLLAHLKQSAPFHKYFPSGNWEICLPLTKPMWII